MSIAASRTRSADDRDRKDDRSDTRARKHDRLAFAAAVALLPAAILPPIVFAVPELPGFFDRRAVIPVSIVLLLLPALAGLAAMRIGLRRLTRLFRTAAGGDQAVAVWRILAALLLFFYGFGFTPAASAGIGGSYCVAIAAVGLVAGWLLLLLAVVHPSPVPLRRYSGIVADAALLSAFLHFGGGSAAAAYPFYFLLIVYSGWRFGIDALTLAAVLSLAGFGMVVATTEFWRDLPLLTAGLIGALAIVPAATGVLLRALAASQQSIAAAAALRGRALSAVGGALRQALTIAAPAGDARHDSAAIRALRAQLQDAGNLLSVAAGTVSREPVPFDLHALVYGALADLRGDAAKPGPRLTTRIDPALPFRLRGASQQLGRLVHNLVALGLAQSSDGPVRLSIDGLALDKRHMRLRLRVRGGTVTLPSEHPAFLVAEQLAASIGGEIVHTAAEPGRPEVSVIVPVAIDQTASEALDLEERPVLLVSDNSQFAGELAEPLSACRADIRWIGGCEAALGYLARLEAPGRPLLIVDGCADPLPALSFVHRAAEAPSGAPFILLIAAAEHAARIAELTDGSIDNVLAAPVSPRLLRNALHAMPLDERVSVSGETINDTAQLSTAQVTPIASHPRFAADARDLADTLDAGTVESLRALGGDDDFLEQLVAKFRDETQPIMETIGRAAAQTDSAAFCTALDALRRCAGHVGGMSLSEATLRLRDIGEDELRQHGHDHLQRLAAELARLDAALTELLVAPQARRQ